MLPERLPGLLPLGWPPPVQSQYCSQRELSRKHSSLVILCKTLVYLQCGLKSVANTFCSLTPQWAEREMCDNGDSKNGFVTKWTDDVHLVMEPHRLMGLLRRLFFFFFKACFSHT